MKIGSITHIDNACNKKSFDQDIRNFFELNNKIIKILAKIMNEEKLIVLITCMQ